MRSPDPFAPSSHYPFGQQKEILGAGLVDTVVKDLTAEQCLQIALNKLHETDSNRERSLAITKIQEAQHWLWQERSQARHRFANQAMEEKTDGSAPDRDPR